MLFDDGNLLFHLQRREESITLKNRKLRMDIASLYLKTKDLSVLLAEDHTPSRREMHEILQELFYRVVSVEDGEEAFRLYEASFHERQPFDLVITDIQMPHINGVSLVHKIKALSKDQAIIVISAYPENQYLLELINTGLSHFMIKPIEHTKFFEVLSGITAEILEKKEKPDRRDALLLQVRKDLIWDAGKRLLKYQNKTIKLSKNELLFIEALAANGEQITTTQSLLEIFYCKGIDINENGIRNLVLRLRKKLPEETIQTIYGMGYKFHF